MVVGSLGLQPKALYPLVGVEARVMTQGSLNQALCLGFTGSLSEGHNSVEGMMD